MILSRRRLLGSIGLGTGGLMLSGCEKIGSTAPAQALLTGAEGLTYSAQRLVMDRNALAPEYRPAEMSPYFRTNGSTQPASAEYRAHQANGFRDWRLGVIGLVRHPLSIPLEGLAMFPQRTQITRHDCVEGWSAIGQWSGPRLGPILDAAGLLPNARFIVFRCADTFGATPFYESIDLVDAYHPQTILATRMNGQPLPVGHGAPARLRIERQLGYKQAKYVMSVEAVDDLARVGAGKGGFWEDTTGYEWYAGI